jgi:hypothetical protein
MSVGFIYMANQKEITKVYFFFKKNKYVQSKLAKKS